MTRLPDYDEEWGEAFVTRMREHMDQLYASVDEEEQLTVSNQPFCGCQDCNERERYLLAIILVIEGYEAGKVRLVDVG